MLRATTHCHEQLREVVTANPLAIMRVDRTVQAVLTWFYDPRCSHTLESLRALQREAARLDPSLPQRAGKAYALLMRLLPQMEALDAQPRRKEATRVVHVFSEVRPTIGPRAIADVPVRLIEDDVLVLRPKTDPEDDDLLT